MNKDELLNSTLKNDRASFSELKKALKVIDGSEFEFGYSLGVSSNVTLNGFDVYLKKQGYISEVNADVQMGGYDDLQGDFDSFKSNGIQNVLVLLNFDNLLPSFESQVEHLDDEFIYAKIMDVKSSLLVALSGGDVFQSITITDFHLSFVGSNELRVKEVLGRFNVMLRECADQFDNVSLLSLSAVVADVGRYNAIDSRFYFMSKAPYKRLLLDHLARRLTSASRQFGARVYKAVVFDCDNTLWGGVVGEDLLGGIALNPYDYPGNIFWRIQQEILSLIERDVIICLCSKNNPEDVLEVLEEHPHCLLSNENIVAKKVNWSSKVDNILALSEELNIGLDSMVFVDDSSFECESVKARLPSVNTIQVPKNISEYISVFDTIKDLFPYVSSRNSDLSKTQQYKIRELSEKQRMNFSSQEEYLESLEIKALLTFNESSGKARISELSQKSNQFNLTTKRYTSLEVGKLIDSSTAVVAAVDVTDKFGGCGLTGAVIGRINGSVFSVDAFFMSCRVIARSIEFSIWPEILKRAVELGAKRIHASYYPTSKNMQVADFYDRLGFVEVHENSDGARKYEQEIKQLELIKIDWIEVEISDC